MDVSALGLVVATPVTSEAAAVLAVTSKKATTMTVMTRLEGDGGWRTVTPVEAGTDQRHGGCRGYYELDGERQTRYLDGIWLRPAAITPTGEVWVFGHEKARRDPGVYIITPDR